jgi:hypothetical protein
MKRSEGQAETTARLGRSQGMRLTHAAFALAPALALLASLVYPLRSTVAAVAKQPVLVELYSSEGCSSCPPADAALARLAREQPVAGAEVIALELHVDYWNHLGWADPFSSPAFTARQRAYADAFGQRGVYTPQMVVDGAAELIGSNERAARKAIAAAAQQPRAKITLARSGDKVTITVTELPAAGEASDLILAITEDGLSTAVPRGENAGATLVHAPVARALRRVLEIAPGEKGLTEAKDVSVQVDPAWKRENLRAVAFVERRASRRIVGVGAISLR